MARGQRFGIVAILAIDEVEDERGTLKARRDALLHALKTQMAQWCAGLAGVTNSRKHTALLRPIALIATRHHLGCDGAVFGSEAWAWLDKRLRSRWRSPRHAQLT